MKRLLQSLIIVILVLSIAQFAIAGGPGWRPGPGPRPVGGGCWGGGCGNNWWWPLAAGATAGFVGAVTSAVVNPYGTGYYGAGYYPYATAPVYTAPVVVQQAPPVIIQSAPATVVIQGGCSRQVPPPGQGGTSKIKPNSYSRGDQCWSPVPQSRSNY